MHKILLVLLLCLPLSLYAQNPKSDSAWLVQNYSKRDVYITMRDGVRLYTSLYTPKDKKETHPFLINRTPYSIAPYGNDTFKAYWNTYLMQYFREGYIIVLQDVRGRYMSEGQFVDVRPFIPNKKSSSDIDEASDTYDTIDWLVKYIENNNGRVGVWGISYPGFYATMAALSGHPALKAASPQAPVTDWFMGDDFHHNGALMLMDAFGFYSGFGKPRPYPTRQGAGGYDFKGQDMYSFYLKTKTIDSLSKLIGDSIQFWNDLCKHPDYDSFWKARNPRNFVQYIPDSCATLVVGGLFDAEDCYGAWNLYKAIELKAHNENTLVEGPWSHGEWAKDSGTYMGNPIFDRATSVDYRSWYEKAFFDRHLLNHNDISKGKQLLSATYGEANIFITGANKWISYPRYAPLYNTDGFSNLFLQSNGNLSFTFITETKKSDYYTSDPAKPVPFNEGVHTSRTREYMTDDQRFATSRPDVLSYQTPILDTEVTVVGPLTADLFVSLSTTDADFIVKIIDVFPDDFKYVDNINGHGNGKNYIMSGYQMLVRGEVMRGRYRNSFTHPVPFTPGEITEVKYKLPDIAHCFKKGHRIMVQIQSTWFPLVDRNPQQFINIYKAKPEDFVKTKVHIYYDREHPSHIVLPISTH